jgi:hypothetical protein
LWTDDWYPVSFKGIPILLSFWATLKLRMKHALECPTGAQRQDDRQLLKKCLTF